MDPALELAKTLQQIKALQRVLGNKTQEDQRLKEAVEYGRAKNRIVPSPLLQEGDR